jgi:hypothetical protein
LFSFLKSSHLFLVGNYGLRLVVFADRSITP